MRVVDQRLVAVGHAVFEVRVPAPGGLAELAIEPSGDTLDFRVEDGRRRHLRSPVLADGRKAREQLVVIERSSQAVVLDVRVILWKEIELRSDSSLVARALHVSIVSSSLPVDIVGDVAVQHRHDVAAAHRSHEVLVLVDRNTVPTRLGIDKSGPVGCIGLNDTKRQCGIACRVSLSGLCRAGRNVDEHPIWAVEAGQARSVLNGRGKRIGRYRRSLGTVQRADLVCALVGRAPAPNVLTSQSVLVFDLATNDEVQLVVEQPVTIRRTEVPISGVGTAALGPVTRDLPTLELVVEKDVLNTGDGARAVRSRGTTRYDVDALDEDLWDEVEVDLVALRGLYETLAIDHDQGAATEVRVQAAQVGNVCTDEVRLVTGTGRGERGGIGWRQCQRLTNVHHAQIFHLGVVDDGGRRGCREIAGALDARSRNRDLFEGGRGRARLRGGLVRGLRTLRRLLRLCGGAQTQHEGRGPYGAGQVFRKSRLESLRAGHSHLHGGIYRGMANGHQAPSLESLSKQAGE